MSSALHSCALHTHTVHDVVHKDVHHCELRGLVPAWSNTCKGQVSHMLYVVHCCMMCVHTVCLHVACQMRVGSVHHNVSSFHSYALGVAGLCLWWEFGTISPAVGAFIAPIEDHPEPMTLKMKNAGETHAPFCAVMILEHPGQPTAVMS